MGILVSEKNWYRLPCWVVRRMGSCMLLLRWFCLSPALSATLLCSCNTVGNSRGVRGFVWLNGVYTVHLLICASLAACAENDHPSESAVLWPRARPSTTLLIIHRPPPSSVLSERGVGQASSRVSERPTSRERHTRDARSTK